jgi:aryl-phospho-beta-D-glucosidase BglC (GH1 family)
MLPSGSPSIAIPLDFGGGLELKWARPPIMKPQVHQTASTLTRRQFVRAAAIALGGSATFTPPSSVAEEPASSVPARRLERLATGANICGWFRFPRNESDHLERYVQDPEAEMMARIGLRHVRLCVAPKVIMDAAQGTVREDRWKLLEAALRRLHRAGLLVMIDLHNEDRADELNSSWQNAFVDFWGALAQRLADFDPDLTMLEIVNEPVFAKREEEWNTLNARLAGAIRDHAPKHTIVTSGPNWGGIDGLRKLKLLADPNVVYSFHCYDPFAFTHQGATWSSEGVKPLRGVPYPSSPEAVASLLPSLDGHPEAKALLEKYGRDRWNKEKLAARFRQGIEWGAQHRVPLYCGEFGVYPAYAKPDDRSAWFRDFGEVLAANKIGWAVWGWDEGFGLNRKHVDGKPVVDSVVARALGLRVA